MAFHVIGWDHIRRGAIFSKSTERLGIRNANVGYATFALGYQADVGDAARAVSVKEPTIVAVPTAAAQHFLSTEG